MVNISSQRQEIKNDFFYNLIQESLKDKNSRNLVSYFFKNKLEKEEYIDFLENLILFIKKEFIFIENIQDIFEDKQLIEKNNVLARNIADKWIVKIINYGK